MYHHRHQVIPVWNNEKYLFGTMKKIPVWNNKKYQFGTILKYIFGTILKYIFGKNRVFNVQVESLKTCV